MEWRRLRLLALGIIPAVVAGITTTGGASAQAPETQAQVRTAVLQALIRDPQLGRYPLAASVDATGHVVLRGTLPTKQDKDRATHLAKHIRDVRGVDNQIAVNDAVAPLAGGPAAAPAAPAEASSADAQTVILNALAVRPGLRGVAVAVNPSQVVLSGRVNSSQDKDQAAAIAQRNAGGRTLKNKIEVEH